MRTRFEQYLLDELWRAYYTARKGKRRTVDEHRFELFVMENILSLHEAILRRAYHPGRGVAFIVHDPVTREIVAAPFRDRVVHHLLFNSCAEWWDRRFLPGSSSCRVGKGTLYAQKLLQRHICRAMAESDVGRAFIVKLDLQGYFMSLRHQKLYERVLWGLDRQFYAKPGMEVGLNCHVEDKDRLYRVIKYLWHEVIFDLPMQEIIIRGSRLDWRTLPRNKSLFNQPRGRGIVIGNLTSQLLSNIFMDQFDRFVVFDLGYRNYGRYVDDFYIVVPIERREQLLRDVKVIRSFLKRELSLTVHPKKVYAQEVAHGMPFVGAVIYPSHKVPGKRACQKCMMAAQNFVSTGEGIDGVVSRIGAMRHLNSKTFLNKVFDEVGWEN